jgi:DNA-binding XRE family transcriptional regulator
VKSVKKFLKLEYYRKKYCIKQIDMANALETCLSNYSNKENGRTPFFLNEMITIRNFLNEKAISCGDVEVTLDDIFMTT